MTQEITPIIYSYLMPYFINQCSVYFSNFISWMVNDVIISNVFKCVDITATTDSLEYITLSCGYVMPPLNPIICSIARIVVITLLKELISRCDSDDAIPSDNNIISLNWKSFFKDA